MFASNVERKGITKNLEIIDSKNLWKKMKIRVNSNGNRSRLNTFVDFSRMFISMALFF
jgi:hypothetical protein